MRCAPMEMSTSVCAAAEDYSEGEIHTIGVAMYDPDSAEMEMFGDYYRDYIEEGFPVKFIFSGKITDAQSECDFIEEAKGKLCISFCLQMDFRMS